MSHDQSKKSDEILRNISKCVLCGRCKAACPTYDENPLEGMGARGRMMLLRGLLTDRIQPSKLLNERLFSCLLCGACSGSCPLGVDVQEAMYWGRFILRNKDKKRWLLRSVVKYSSRWPELAFRVARMNQHILLPFLARLGIIPFSPELPGTSLRNLEQLFKVHKKKGRVAIFTGCSINFVFPQLGESLIHVLQKLRYEVVLPKGEVCCGAPLRGLGLEEEAIRQAKKNYQVFSRLKVDAILSLCPTCTLTLKYEYPKMIGRGLERAMDISTFFKDKLEPTERIGKTAYYHDPCHLAYGLGVKKEPREIIKKAGIDLLKAGEQGCCGFAGLFCVSYKEMSGSLMQKTTQRVRDSQADTLITSCPGCLMQLSRTVTDRPVLHLIELIEEAYCFRSPEKKEKESETQEPTLF